MAVHGGGYTNVPCQRPGCRHVLATINDLAAHLVLHDIDPRRTDNRYHFAPLLQDKGHVANFYAAPAS